MTNLKRMRLLCGLRQIDVSVGTGIPLNALSLVERGLGRLNHSQSVLLTQFLRESWARCLEADAWVNSGAPDTGQDSPNALVRFAERVTA